MNFIEVCSGAGGLSLGFINKGFKPILLNDIDKSCISTLKENHKAEPNRSLPLGSSEASTTGGSPFGRGGEAPEFASKDVEIFTKSFTEIETAPYEHKVDLLMGGVPCQSFSQSGKRKGLEDSRGNLILEFIELIKKLSPKVFLIENVKGLLTHNKGETFRKILDTIHAIDKYDIYHKVLNSNDYDVAQKRERLFIVGVRRDLHKVFSFPTPLEYKPVLRDVISDIQDVKSEGHTYSREKYEIMRMVPEGGCWVDLPVDIQKKYLKKSYNSGGGRRGIAKRLSMDKPCLTLTTSPAQKQTERCHPLFTRPLNIMEYRRIQSFPDDYIIKGSVLQKYRQIGNAVPVKLAEHMADTIKKILL